MRCLRSILKNQLGRKHIIIMKLGVFSTSFNHQSIPKIYVYLIGDLVCLVVLLGKEHSSNFWCLKCKLYPSQYIKNNMLVVSVGLLKYCS